MENKKKHRFQERERKKENGEVVTDTAFLGVRNYISGFQGSQVVPVRLCGRGNAYNRN
jgi:hypothetical protein